ncbi:MAG: hypothetical protein HRT47_01640 [Candidatus Caenarcaniphilales bacterium]|nr:hypothetical protein [Candidatus Caenarcaniphilales bacterium]
MKIKHETTLEEAKKIKELGFDFSPACEKFYLPENNIPIYGVDGKPFYEGFYYKHKDKYGEIRQDCVTQLYSNGAYIDLKIYEKDLNDDFRLSHIQAKKLLIPITPYPILEACLIKNTEQWDRLIKNPRTGKLYAKNQGELGCYKPNEDYDMFDDCFKAFIWCAKSYPDETKEQFNTVMEMYK